MAKKQPTKIKKLTKKEFLERVANKESVSGYDGYSCEKLNLSNADLSNADLSGANLSYANLSYANLNKTDLSYANLSVANLNYAKLNETNFNKTDLSYTNLRGANFRGANFSDVDFNDADLRYADLTGAKNIPFHIRSPLNILKSQPGKLIAYKCLNKCGISLYQNKRYEIGKIYRELDCNADERENCGKGLNVATLERCLQNSNLDIENRMYIEVEFTAKDIVAIPILSDGKFRVKKFKVLRKLTKRELKKAIKPLYPSK